MLIELPIMGGWSVCVRSIQNALDLFVHCSFHQNCKTREGSDFIKDEFNVPEENKVAEFDHLQQGRHLSELFRLARHAQGRRGRQTSPALLSHSSRRDGNDRLSAV